MSDTTELVDLAVIFPDLEIELKYACADNITGKAIYQQARCLLHKDAITALAKSISIAQLSGLQLVITMRIAHNKHRRCCGKPAQTRNMLLSDGRF